MLYPIITAAFSLYTYYSVSKINNARHVFDKTTEEVEDLRIQVGMAITFNKLTTLSQVLALNGFGIHSSQLIISIYRSLTEGTIIPTPYIHPREPLVSIKNTFILGSTILADLVLSKVINDGENLYKAVNLYGNYYLDQMKYKLGLVDHLSTPHPLFTAIESKNPALAQYIIDLGADVNVKDADHDTPIVSKLPLYPEEFEIVRILVVNGADVNVKSSNGDTPLLLNHQLNAHSNNTIINSKLLIEHGANVNAQNACGKTALYKAIEHNDFDSAKLLINKGANVNLAIHFGDTPLHLAARYKSTDIAKLLIDNGADVNAKNNIGETPLYSIFWAHGRGDGRNGYIIINETKVWCSAPLNGEMFDTRSEMISLLAKSGADVDARDNDGYTLLHRALLYGKTDRVKLLVENGADVHAKDSNGYSLPHKALLYRKIDRVKLLVENGADVHAKDSNGYSLLHKTFFDMKIDWIYIKLILKNCADINTQNEDGITPLSLLIRIEEPDKVSWVEYLLHSGADPNISDNLDLSPLHIAAARENLEVIDLLFKYGANPHSKDYAGNTPAVYASNEEVAKFIAEKTAEYDSSYIMYNPFAIFKTQLCLDYDDYCSCRPF